MRSSVPKSAEGGVRRQLNLITGLKKASQTHTTNTWGLSCLPQDSKKQFVGRSLLPKTYFFRSLLAVPEWFPA